MLVKEINWLNLEVQTERLIEECCIDLTLCCSKTTRKMTPII